MPSGLINLALGLAIQVGTPGPSEAPGFPAPYRAYGQYGSEGSAEQRLPFDSQLPWMHGYFQEIPAYNGHPVGRPYNYKDVLSQSQTFAGWGERPTMPYSQQFWHKYQDQATMLKASRLQTAPMPYAMYPQYSVPQGQAFIAQPVGLQVPVQQPVWTPAANAVGAGPIGAGQIIAPNGPHDQIQVPMLPPASDFNQINYRR